MRKGSDYCCAQGGRGIGGPEVIRVPSEARAKAEQYTIRYDDGAVYGSGVGVVPPG